ncbi:MAG: META domain-containing protein [Actinomycetota bacterium]
MVTLVVGASACAENGSSGDGDPTSIVGTTWILGAASAEALVDEVMPGDARATIRFGHDGAVGGSTACNTFGGDYTAGDDGALSIEPGAMTQIACEEPLMRLEAAYTAALAEVASFEVIDEGAGLVLSGGETTLTYTAERPVALEGTAWRVDGIAIGGDAVSSTIAGAEAELTFDAAGVTGTTGCNRLTGSSVIDGGAREGSISFSDIGTTTKLCEPDVMEQEAQILAALEAAERYSIEGSTMSLTDADGSFLLSLVA